MRSPTNPDQVVCKRIAGMVSALRTATRNATVRASQLTASALGAHSLGTSCRSVRSIRSSRSNTTWSAPLPARNPAHSHPHPPSAGVPSAATQHHCARCAGSQRAHVAPRGQPRELLGLTIVRRRAHRHALRARLDARAPPRPAPAHLPQRSGRVSLRAAVGRAVRCCCRGALTRASLGRSGRYAAWARSHRVRKGTATVPRRLNGTATT